MDNPVCPYISERMAPDLLWAIVSSLMLLLYTCTQKKPISFKKESNFFMECPAEICDLNEVLKLLILLRDFPYCPCGDCLPCFPCSKSWKMTRFNLSSTFWILVLEKCTSTKYLVLSIFCCKQGVNRCSATRFLRNADRINEKNEAGKITPQPRSF